MSINFKVNDVIQVRQEYQLGSDVAFNILHWQVTDVRVTATGLPPATEINWLEVAEDLAGDFYSMIGNAWSPAASAAVLTTGCTVQNIWAAPRSTAVTFTGAPAIAGQVAGDSLPLQDTPTILKKTQFGQRWGLGRLFFVGWPEAEAAQGRITNTGVTSLNTFASTLMAFAGGTAGPYTYSMRPILFADDGSAVRITDVDDMVLSNNIIKTQRRRRPGKGM